LSEVFDRSHISYNGGETGPVLNVETVDRNTFLTSNMESDQFARDEATDEDRLDNEKAAIIKKSIDVVMQRADLQATLRHAKAYEHVKSKVARCLKVQNKVAKQNKRKKVQEHIMETSEEALLNSKLSVEPFGLRFGSKNSAWVEKTRESMKPREEEVRQKEQDFMRLEETLKARRNK